MGSFPPAIPHFPSGPVFASYTPPPSPFAQIFPAPQTMDPADPFDIFHPMNRPPIPHPSLYSTPHGLRTRSYRSSSALIGRENHLADTFRRAGYHRLAIEFEGTGQDFKLAFLRKWLAINQHIPPIYLIFGTDLFTNPLDHSVAGTSDDSESDADLS
jgi:hypothetical protein